MYGDQQSTVKETKEIQNEAKYLEGHLESCVGVITTAVLLGLWQPLRELEEKEGKGDCGGWVRFEEESLLLYPPITVWAEQLQAKEAECTGKIIPYKCALSPAVKFH